MVKHIVFWKLKDHADGQDREQNLERMQEALNGLASKIAEVVSLEVGINKNPAPAAWEISLYTSFNSWEDLETYQKHPDHQEVVQLVQKVVMDRAVVDYED
jgi:hypothetical protein